MVLYCYSHNLLCQTMARNVNTIAFHSMQEYADREFSNFVRIAYLAAICLKF